jgi:hypothetical protein
MDTSKKITLATFKSFVKKNREQLLINVGSKFDGMTDCVQSTNDGGFSAALNSDTPFSNNLGIAGVWLVGGSRDYFSPINENGLSGIRASNCCGSFTIAVRNAAEQVSA